MTYRVLAIFFISIAVIWVSCRNNNAIYTHYDNGAVYEKYFVDKDSMKHGQYIQFYENGDTLETSQYIHGKLEGIRKLYYTGNRTEIMEKYEMGMLNGPYRVFYEDGNLNLIAPYKNNVLEGELKKYYPNGSIMEEVEFKNNEENGSFTEYYENGGKKWVGTYQSGANEIGELLHFAENGDTIKKMFCDEMYICRTVWLNEKYVDGNQLQ